MARRFLPILAFLIASSAAAAVAQGGAEPTAGNPYIVSVDTTQWIEALRSDDLFQIDPAIESLGALGDAVLPALEAAFAAEGEQARVNLVEVLRDIRTPATVPLLRLAARDESAEVRGDAVEALGKIAHPDGRETLEAALFDRDAHVVTQAGASCGDLCTSPKAMRRLVEMALLTEPRGRANNARHSLSRLAGSVAERDKVRALVEEIAVPVMKDGGDSNRCHAALAVAAVGMAGAIEALDRCARENADKEPLQSVLSIKALGESGSAGAVAPLVALANGEHKLLAPAACGALTGLAKSTEDARPAAAECARRRREKAAQKASAAASKKGVMSSDSHPATKR